MEKLGPIAVVGAGSWGTTLSQILAKKGYPVDLWVYEKELCEIIVNTRENSVYLPGIRLHDHITPCNTLAQVVRNHPFIVMVVPSHVYRQAATEMIAHIDQETILVSATKGIETGSLLMMSDIWRELLPSSEVLKVLSLSGPSFAKEVAREIPTAITIAGNDLKLAQLAQQVFSTKYFRVYTSSDKIGVELAGALKNVIAIAAGISDGLGFGHNTRAALITRGLAEMSRLGAKMGANVLTFSGLSGVGDLLLTCTGDLSRNRHVGYQLGQGKTLTEILGEMRMVAEGVKTAQSVHFLAEKMGVEMPISDQVYQVLYEEKSPQTAVQDLMERALKHELEYSS
jgi:glycerol-3-phosphate dehydrogenase (NAD(P)+)